MEWCTVEIWDPGESFDQRHENERLVKMLRAAGHEVTAREIGSGTGWGTWRNHTGQLLAALLPLTIDESKGRP